MKSYYALLVIAIVSGPATFASDYESTPVNCLAVSLHGIIMTGYLLPVFHWSSIYLFLRFPFLVWDL